jgi:hypothetical protein
MGWAEAADREGEKGACWSQHGEPVMTEEKYESVYRARCMYKAVAAFSDGGSSSCSRSSSRRRRQAGRQAAGRGRRMTRGQRAAPGAAARGAAAVLARGTPSLLAGWY